MNKLNQIRAKVTFCLIIEAVLALFVTTLWLLFMVFVTPDNVAPEEVGTFLEPLIYFTVFMLASIFIIGTYIYFLFRCPQCGYILSKGQRGFCFYYKMKHCQNCGTALL